MPVFAVYHVPPADDPLYQRGTDVLGYDVRSAAFTAEINPTRARFSAFDPAWVGPAQEYGFHLTIGHAVNFEADRLGAIESEIEQVLNLFDRTKPFVLTPLTPFVMPLGGDSLGLRLDANMALTLFHALVIARIHPLGTGTPFSAEVAAGQWPGLAPASAYRTAAYFHPLILDDWYPHYSLLRACPADQLQTIAVDLEQAMPAIDSVTVGTIALLVKRDGDTHFHLHREFDRAAYPQPRP